MTHLRSLDLENKLDEYDSHEQHHLLKQLSFAALEDIDERTRTTIAARLRTARVKPQLRPNVEKTLTILLKRYSEVLRDEHRGMYGGRMDGLVRQYRTNRLVDIFGHMRSSIASSQTVRLHKGILDRTLTGVSNAQ